MSRIQGRMTRSRLGAAAEMPRPLHPSSNVLDFAASDFCDDAKFAEHRVFAKKCTQLTVGLELLDPATLHEALDFDPTVVVHLHGGVSLKFSGSTNKSSAHVPSSSVLGKMPQ